MARKVRGLIVTAALLAGAWTGETACRAQELAPLSAPEAVTGPGCAAQLGPPACAPDEDSNGSRLNGDSLLDRPSFPPPGWFGALEIGVVKPHVQNALTAAVDVGGTTEQVFAPAAPMSWTGSPRLEVGYRFGEGFGEALLSYRELASEGTATVADFDPEGAGYLRSRLDVNVVDLDYANREFSLGPNWDMRWKIGGRLASAFFDSRVTGEERWEKTSNNFFGGGPHIGLDLWHCLGTPEVSVFGRVETSFLVGEIHQSFEESFAPVTGLGSGEADAEQTQAVPVLNVEVGLGWAPEWAGRRLRFALGYQYERWWYLGEIGDSRGDLTVQGLFVRGEWNY